MVSLLTLLIYAQQFTGHRYENVNNRITAQEERETENQRGWDLSGMGIGVYDLRVPENLNIDYIKSCFERVYLKIDVSNSQLPKKPKDSRKLIKRIFYGRDLLEFPTRMERLKPVRYFQRAFNDFESYLCDKDLLQINVLKESNLL
jgi:hypothetical protein